MLRQVVASTTRPERLRAAAVAFGFPTGQENNFSSYHEAILEAFIVLLTLPMSEATCVCNGRKCADLLQRITSQSDGGDVPSYKSGNTVSCKSEVNRFFGWAIFEAYMEYRDKADQDEDGTNSPLDMEESDDDNNDDHEEIHHNHPVEFIRQMILRHADAIQDPDYMNNCYDTVLMLKNNGGLTLVTKEYFNFGKALTKVVAESMDKQSMEKEGDECLTLARKRVKDERETLLANFLGCDSPTSLEEKTRVKIFDLLLQKTMNARHGMVIKKYKNEETKRKGKRHEGQDLRTKFNKN